MGLAWLYCTIGELQPIQYLKSVFLEILNVTTWSVFQNKVTYNLTLVFFGCNWRHILPFAPPYDTPTFKTNALRLVSNEGWVKLLLLLYKRLIQPYLSLLLLYLETYFAICTPYDTPTFKTNVFLAMKDC